MFAVSKIRFLPKKPETISAPAQRVDVIFTNLTSLQTKRYAKYFRYRSSLVTKAGKVLTHPVDILIVVERGAWK